MKQKRDKRTMVVLIIFILLGIGIIVLPPLFQDRNLSDQSDEMVEQLKQFKMDAGMEDNIVIQPELPEELILKEPTEEDIAATERFTAEKLTGEHLPVKSEQTDDASKSPMDPSETQRINPDTENGKPDKEDSKTAATMLKTDRSKSLAASASKPTAAPTVDSTGIPATGNTDASLQIPDKNTKASPETDEKWNPFTGTMPVSVNANGLNILFATPTPKPAGDPQYIANQYGNYQTDKENINPVENPDKFNEWLVEALKTPAPTPVPTSTPVPTPTPNVTPTPKIGKTNVNLAKCYNTNDDFVAWITIPGTNVDYPIVQTNNIDYYLDHTFEGKKSDLGTLFTFGSVDWEKPSQNIIIYGHDVEGGGNKMFKALLQYKKENFYNTHRYIYLDSIYRTGVYKIFAVFDITVGDIIPSTASFANGKEFMTFVNTAKSLSLYGNDTHIDENDTIICLTTCDRYFKRGVGRFLVMAVKVE